MKHKTKPLLLLLAMVLLVTGSFAGTYAYLSDREKVVNTFTVGAVDITLDESEVTEDGIRTGSGKRVIENKYRLIPGRSYVKDPMVQVGEKSESCWLFVKIDNGLAGVESRDDDYQSIAEQIDNYKWTPLDGATNVFYTQYEKGSNREYPVFDSFAIDGPSNTTESLNELTNKGAKITVTAYAVQLSGFENNVSAAWDAVAPAQNS